MNAQDWLNPKNWQNRRRYLSAVTAFTMAAIAGAMFGPVEPTVAESVIAWGFMALVAFVGSYVFGATWDHANIRATTAATARRPLAGIADTQAADTSFTGVNPHGGPEAP